MLQEFQYYLNENLVAKKYPNKEEAKSLMNKAIQRLRYVKEQEITELNASFIFEDIYESLREASQALMSLRGYKPYSHEALIAFLKKFYNFPEADISSFDRYRKLRNRCVYGAFIISTFKCREALKFLERFLPKIREEFEREIV